MNKYGEEQKHMRENIFWHNTAVTRKIRSDNMKQKPVTIWFTGLSGAGKSTLANEIEKILNKDGKYTMLLDGDNIRMGLCNDLGFSEEERTENIRRISEVAKLMNDAGLIVLASFISPYINDRRRARKIIGNDNFVEVFVSTPLEECEKRDTKGLYKNARGGVISNFTGISSPYEVPENPEIVIDTSQCQIDESVEMLINKLQKYLVK
jgi:bifunctional enzyme CysN/CysC